MAFIKIESLCLAYPGLNGNHVRVFDNFDITIEKGEFIAIVGPSGCGKTTILNLIGGLLPPDSGKITVGGLSPEEARLQHYFSFAFQNPVLLPWRTVRENVRLAGDILKDEKAVSRVDELIKLVGLSGFEDSLPAHLSGGMKARVALARAMSFEPEVLLLDEPFGALDEMTRLEMNNLLMNVLSTMSATCILVTHSVSEAIYLADRVFVFSQRPVKIIGNPVNVALPRPRGITTRDCQEFVTMRNKIERDLFGCDFIELLPDSK